jgi:hypothetical protein
MLGNSYVNLNFSGPMVLEKIFILLHPIFAIISPFIVPSLTEIGQLVLEKIFKRFKCIFTLLP